MNVAPASAPASVRFYTLLFSVDMPQAQWKTNYTKHAKPKEYTKLI